MMGDFPSRLVLLRGYSRVQADPDQLVVVSGLAEKLGKPVGPYLGLSLFSSIKPRLHFSPDLNPQLVKRSEQGAVSLQLKELLIEFGLKPWWQYPDLSGPLVVRSLYVPYQGWYRGIWYDGPLLHLWQRQLVSYVLPGTAARLELPWVFEGSSDRDGNRYDSKLARLLAMRSSLALGIRLLLEPRLPINQHISLEVDAFDSKALVLLCLLRIAFPDQSFDLVHLPPVKSHELAWKRLCQNLGILCGKAPRPKSKLAVELPWELLRANLPDQMLAPMVDALNIHSDLIPHRLRPV